MSDEKIKERAISINLLLCISRNAINTFSAFLFFNADLHQLRKFTCAHARSTVSSAMDSLWIGGVWESLLGRL